VKKKQIVNKIPRTPDKTEKPQKKGSEATLIRLP